MENNDTYNEIEELERKLGDIIHNKVEVNNQIIEKEHFNREISLRIKELISERDDIEYTKSLRGKLEVVANILMVIIGVVISAGFSTSLIATFGICLLILGVDIGFLIEDTILDKKFARVVSEVIKLNGKRIEQSEFEKLKKKNRELNNEYKDVKYKTECLRAKISEDDIKTWKEVHEKIIVLNRKNDD